MPFAWYCAAHADGACSALRQAHPEQAFELRGPPRVAKRPAAVGRGRWALSLTVCLILIAGGIAFGQPRSILLGGVPLVILIARLLYLQETTGKRSLADASTPAAGTTCYQWVDNHPCSNLATHAVYRAGEPAPLAWYCAAHADGACATLRQAHPEQTFELRVFSR